MRRALGKLIVLLSVLFLETAAESRPVLAHAHNDYRQVRPLFDALELGYDSIEADVHLVDGRLLVAHDREKARPDRTLEMLYLDPLADLVRKNGGRVGRTARPVILLIDVKSDAEPTWTALNTLLARYAGMLTTFGEKDVKPGAVTVIISGNRVPALQAAQSPRHAAFDGRPEDIDAALPAAVMPLISADWRKYFQWSDRGFPSAVERERLVRYVSSAHTRGRLIRFWNTPDDPELWQELRDAGVDLIGTDDLPKLRSFLDSR